jgi:hypothetical protein
MMRVPVATSVNLDQALSPRTLVVGLKVNDIPCAYPFETLLKQSPIIDEISRVPIIVLLGEDRKSVRAFQRTVDGRKLELFVKPNASPLRLVDAETASEWDFTGQAVNGPLTGKQLGRVAVLEDYWFDWKTYNPNTQIYLLGDH